VPTQDDSVVINGIVKVNGGATVKDLTISARSTLTTTYSGLTMMLLIKRSHYAHFKLNGC